MIKLDNLLVVLLITFLLLSCRQPNNAEINKLRSKINELEQKINKLQSENDSLRQIIATAPKVSTEAGTAPGSGDIQNSGQQESQTSPSYFYGEMLTKRGNRIKVEQFGKIAGDEYSEYKVVGIYREQPVEIPWQNLRKIWVRKVLYSEEYGSKYAFVGSLGLELIDGRYYEIGKPELKPEPADRIVYISIDEITGERRLLSKRLTDICVIAINGRLESLNYCSYCKKYFPEIYRYCNRCGGELQFQNVPE